MRQPTRRLAPLTAVALILAATTAEGCGRGASRDEATAPFATVIRLINELDVDYRLNHYPSYACPFGLTISGATAPLDEPTSIEGGDILCPCDTCREGAARSPACTTVDLLCEALPAVVIPAGGTFDFAWSGVVTLWRQNVPACTRSCSADYLVPAGHYRFTLTEFAGLATGRHWDADAALPAPLVSLHLR